MTRGLSTQQKQLYATLKTKQHKENPENVWFSTQELICELHAEYRIWLQSWRSEPLSNGPWDSKRYRPYERFRISILRALQSLERRGLIVSYAGRPNHKWAAPERLKDEEQRWIDSPSERELRSISWKRGAFIRTLPRNLHMAYKIGVIVRDSGEVEAATKEDFEKISKMFLEAYPEVKTLLKNLMVTPN